MERITRQYECEIKDEPSHNGLVHNKLYERMYTNYVYMSCTFMVEDCARHRTTPHSKTQYRNRRIAITIA